MNSDLLKEKRWQALFKLSWTDEEVQQAKKHNTLDPTKNFPMSLPRFPQCKPEDLFCATVKGDSMIDAKICNGDFLVFQKTDKFVNGSIMCVEFKDTKRRLLKRIGVEGNYVTLIWQDGSGTSLTTKLENVEPVGELIYSCWGTENYS